MESNEAQEIFHFTPFALLPYMFTKTGGTVPSCEQTLNGLLDMERNGI